MVTEWCEEAITALSDLAHTSGVGSRDADQRERTGAGD
jgi:hypothetical protein